MREKYLWLAIIFLTLITVGQACFIYEQSAVANELSPPPVRPEIHKAGHAKQAADSQWEELEKWRGKVRGQLSRGVPLRDPDFDLFFDDSFFMFRLRPFYDIERIRRQLSEEFPEPEKNLFDSYWDAWFARRLRMGQFKTETARTGNEVVLTIHVPGLAAKTADINITEERIKMSFSAKTSSEEKSAGGLVRKESSQSYVKILPLPVDAEPGTGKVEVTGDRVEIKFAIKKGY